MLPNNWQHDDANAKAFYVTNGRTEALAANDASVAKNHAALGAKDKQIVALQESWIRDGEGSATRWCLSRPSLAPLKMH